MNFVLVSLLFICMLLRLMQAQRNINIIPSDASELLSDTKQILSRFQTKPIYVNDVFKVMFESCAQREVSL